jgi:GNAT superfamily N-acetyltransferase
LSLRHGLEIRAATAGDAPGLADLLTSAGLPVAAPDLAARLEALRHGAGAALVALDWGPPSGVVVLHWFQTLAAPRPTARITTLLVAAEARRRGIGRLLLKAAAQAARSAGCGMLELAAPPAEPSVPAFCQALGFTEAGAVFERSLRRHG